MMAPEERLHVAVRQYLDVALMAPGFWTSIDHGAGKLSKRAAGMAKARGVKPGLQDVWVFHPLRTGGCVVVAIELKSAVGKLSPIQKERAGEMMGAGIHCRVARSIEDVETALRLSGVPLRATAGLRLSRAAA